MSELAELERHIQSIQQTRQITNAMYLTSSSKMRKAMKLYEDNKAYMKDIYPILRMLMDHKDTKMSASFKVQAVKRYAYIVITSDQGLAGNYNSEVLALTEGLIARNKPSILFSIGAVGDEYFHNKDYEVNNELEERLKTISTRGARYAAQTIFEILFSEHEVTDVFIIYTKTESAFNHEAVVRRLMPIAKEDYIDHEAVFDPQDVELIPDSKTVLHNTIGIYLMGRIYHAMVQSYAAEHSIRMQTMDSATRNADEMLFSLRKKANQARQEKITQEISEIVSGGLAIGGEE